MPPSGRKSLLKRLLTKRNNYGKEIRVRTFFFSILGVKRSPRITLSNRSTGGITAYLEISYFGLVAEIRPGFAQVLEKVKEDLDFT